MKNTTSETSAVLKKKDACKRIVEFIDYVKVQHEMKPANPTKKGKILYFKRKEVITKY